ncbi:MAG: chromosome segregation protein SMC [Clostridia bacterium]|nr:chromosome segregation protein SMC [Clostridia bacterium]
MYFKKLEMHGFKSFVDPVTIEFNDGITCVVGPNGSGKSNVSDAIRWVLGEQSPKTLRGGKMEDVIFNGTAARKPRGMAEVTLTIDNSTGILPIEYREVAITRRMYRSGESEYLINNNNCRLRDIRELIMDTGIGVDGYSLIGQGKIADIVGDKPESRREIFEEAAGVVMYKTKKKEAERKLANANDNLDRVNDIINEIEGRIGGLREDSIKAKEYLSLKERYEDLEINATIRNIDSLEEKIKTMRSDVENLKLEQEMISNEKSNLNSVVAERREKIEALRTQIDEANEKLIEKINAINEITNKGNVNEERLSALKDNILRLKSELDDLNNKLSTETVNKDSLLKNRKEIEMEELRVQRELAAQSDKYADLDEAANDILSEIEDKKEELFQLNTQLTRQNAELGSIKSMKDTLLEKQSQFEEDQAKLKEQEQDLANRMDLANKSLKDNTSAVEALEKDIAKANGEINELENKRRADYEKLNDLKLEKSRMEARKRTLEELESNYDGYNYAVKYLMKSDLKGIVGVVAELIKVEEKYALAIETALGASMQNVVCKDDGSAKKAVNALKENKAGRLTFLPVQSIKASLPQIPKELSQGKGFIGMANTCIKYDNAYTNIFDYLLGRVALVDNMDNAVALAKLCPSGLRLVTLDGEVINVSGAITGGKYKNKSANILGRKSEIENLAKDLVKIQQEGEELVKTVEKLVSKLDESKLGLEKLLAQKDEASNALRDANSQIYALQEAEQNFQDNKARAERDMASSLDDFNNADSLIEEIQDKIDTLKAKIADKEREIKEGLVAYEKAQVTADEAGDKITDVRLRLTDVRAKYDSIDNFISKIDEIIESFEAQIENKETQLKAYIQEKDGMLTDSEDSAQVLGKLEEEKEELEARISLASGEVDKLSSSIKGEDEQLNNAIDKLDSITEQKYNLEIQLGKSENQFENYKEKLWDEFEISYAQALTYKRADFVMSSAIREIRDIKNKIRSLGDVNVGAIKEYEKEGERYEFLTAQRDDILKAVDELNSLINNMDITISTKFKENFDKVVVNFSSVFKDMFGGGQAELKLDDENNPLEAGIIIEAQPPGKKLQNINLLSGGEKTMTAIALMFAVLKTKPTPFCILDEVEAALDDTNIDRFGDYLKKFREIQFTIITHKRETMEHADVLYGVTMAEKGVSKLLSLKLEDNFKTE